MFSLTFAVNASASRCDAAARRRGVILRATCAATIVLAGIVVYSIPARTSPLRLARGFLDHPADRLIGCYDGDASALLAPIRVHLDRTRQTLLVLNYIPPFIHSFDGTGHVVASFGTRGDGPSDLRGPRWVFGRRNGQIIAHEIFPPRISLFSPGGSRLDSLHLDGSLWVTASGYAAARDEVLVVARRWDATLGSAVYRIDLGSGRVTAVLTEDNLFPDADVHPAERISSVPFGVRLDGAFAIGSRVPCRVEVYSYDGDRLRTIDCAADVGVDRMLGTVVFDEQARLWLQTTAGSGAAVKTDAIRLHVYSASGHYLGSAVHPGVNGVFDVWDSHFVAAIQSDELGNQCIGMWTSGVDGLRLPGEVLDHSEGAETP